MENVCVLASRRLVLKCATDGEECRFALWSRDRRGLICLCRSLFGRWESRRSHRALWERRRGWRLSLSQTNVGSQTFCAGQNLKNLVKSNLKKGGNAIGVDLSSLQRHRHLQLQRKKCGSMAMSAEGKISGSGSFTCVLLKADGTSEETKVENKPGWERELLGGPVTILGLCEVRLRVSSSLPSLPAWPPPTVLAVLLLLNSADRSSCRRRRRPSRARSVSFSLLLRLSNFPVAHEGYFF
jgi:hypothetical protein